MEKYRVDLAAEERLRLERVVTAGKTAARGLMHARILLLADREDQSDEAITAAVGASLRTVKRVRRRLVTEGLEAALDHRPQPPRPEKLRIRGDVEQKLIQLACSEPPRGRCHWTLQLLADEMVVLGLVDRVSTETVRQALKKRPPALDYQSVVYPAAGRRRVCLAHGGRSADRYAALRSGASGDLLRRGVQAIVWGGQTAAGGRSWATGAGGL